MPSRNAVRQAAIALLVIGGATLQFLRTETTHPSLVLKIWGWAYALLGLVAIFALAVYAFYWVRDWRQRRGA